MQIKDEELKNLLRKQQKFATQRRFPVNKILSFTGFVISALLTQ